MAAWQLSMYGCSIRPTVSWPRRCSSRCAAGRGQLPSAEVPLDRTLAVLDEAGVQRGLICAWYGPDGALISNDEVAGWVRRHPDRLTGVASVDIRNPRQAVLDLRRAVTELGFRALRVVPWLWGLPPNHRLYYPLLRRVRGTRRPVHDPGRAYRPAANVGDGPPDPLPRRCRPGLPRPGHRGRAHRLPVDRRDDRAGDEVPERLHRHLGLRLAPLPGRAGRDTCAATAAARCCSARTTR